jgi:hypothetical protein
MGLSEDRKSTACTLIVCTLLIDCGSIPCGLGQILQAICRCRPKHEVGMEIDLRLRALSFSRRSTLRGMR